MILASYTHVGSVLAGFGITVGSFGLFALWTVRRGRKLSALVPPEDRRWS